MLHTSHVQEDTAEGCRAGQGQQRFQAAPQQTGAAEPQPAVGAGGASASAGVPAPVGNDMTAKSRLYTRRAQELYKKVRPLHRLSATLSMLSLLGCCGSAGSGGGALAQGVALCQ